MRFRLITIAWVFALLAAGMAAFGAWGVAATVLFILFWALVLLDWKKPIVALIGVAALGCLFVALLLPAVASARGAAIRHHCFNNLKQIALALEAYEAQHGAFPPAYVADADGKPMHSWRVLLLPYLGEQDLFQAYDMAEPWDGPKNRKLWERVPGVYRCPSLKECRRLRVAPFGPISNHTASYMAVVGESTMWPGACGRRKAEITDSPANTITVFEHSASTAPWTAPVDLTYDEAMPILTSDDLQGHVLVDESAFAATFDRSLSLGGFADSHGRAVLANMKEEYARGLLTVAGGEAFDDDYEPTRADAVPHRVTVVLWRRVYGLTAFAALAFLPSVRLLRPRDERRLEEAK